MIELKASPDFSSRINKTAVKNRIKTNTVTKAIRLRITRLTQFASILLESIRDANSYFLSASIVPKNSFDHCEHLESEIIRRAHVIEKGLSMRDFRPRFGPEMVRELCKCLDEWEAMNHDRAKCSEALVHSASGVLYIYKKRHDEIGVDVSDIVAPKYQKYDTAKAPLVAGTKRWLQPTDKDIEGFLTTIKTRSSVRSYSKEKIPDKALIEDAIRNATVTPSVCNRQTWRVHVFGESKAQEVLAVQGGNRGFGQMIPYVLIVTSDMRYFIGAHERYQPWIDGGMFAMTLLFALHAKKLGAVALNWSVVNRQDNKLRNLANISIHERIIMMIGCGYPSDGAIVTESLRKPVSDITIWH